MTVKQLIRLENRAIIIIKKHVPVHLPDARNVKNEHFTVLTINRKVWFSRNVHKIQRLKDIWEEEMIELRKREEARII